MRIAVCDDEDLFLEKLIGCILNHIKPEESGDVRITSFHSGEDLLKAWSEGNSFDILFLDVIMAQMDGIETAREIRKQGGDPVIVFISSYRDPAVHGYEVNACRYLLKPLDENNLKEAFETALKEYRRKRLRFYTVQVRHERITFHTSEILYFESRLRRVILNTVDTQYEFYARLEEEARKLKPVGFAFSHTSFLVNLAHVRSLQKFQLRLTNHIKLPVSRHCAKPFTDAYIRFLGGIDLV